MIRTLVKTSEYHDSVALMLISRELGAMPGVTNVSVVMGTTANTALLRQAGLLTPRSPSAWPQRSGDCCQDQRRRISPSSPSRSPTIALAKGRFVAGGRPGASHEYSQCCLFCSTGECRYRFSRRAIRGCPSVGCVARRAARAPVQRSRPSKPTVLALFSNLKFQISNFKGHIAQDLREAAVPAEGIAGSSIVTTMARNGTDFGIRIAGLPGRWFVAPAGRVKGLYFPGFTKTDANLDMGDSTITETAGFGGMAMAGAPAIVKFVGGAPQDAIDATLEMYEICAAEHDTFLIPALDFRGTPVGIDVRRVVETGISPRLNTGIAHKVPGVGQVGAGLLRAPIECFVQAFEAMRETWNVKRQRRDCVDA